jgi:hypothetical protein
MRLNKQKSVQSAIETSYLSNMKIDYFTTLFYIFYGDSVQESLQRMRNVKMHKK